MTELRAILVDFLIAHSVNILNVLPPLVFLALLGHDVPEALLAEVLNQNVLPLYVGALVVHGTVATIGETFLSFEFSIAAGACPRHNPGSEGSLCPHEFIVIAEVPNEVERLIIG
jgi:hypothetical protein